MPISFWGLIIKKGQRKGFFFRVWAPAAKAVSVVGDFNEWNPSANPLEKLPVGGIWEGFIPGLKQFDLYKYAITGSNGNVVLKADPYGFHMKRRREQPLNFMISLAIAGMIPFG